MLIATPDDISGRFSSIIEYHRPAFDQEQLKTAESQITSIRAALQTDFIRSVGSRGYTLVVSDPILKQLGYEELTVKQSSASNRIHVQITVDHEEYEFDLDAGYRIILGGDVKRFVNPQDQTWLELLTLSHLKKVICTEEDEESIKAELVGGAKQYEGFRRQQVSRREHLRRQTPGRNYSTESFNRCLKSQLPVKNLFLINRMKAEIGKGGTLETGIWTYVSGTEYTDIPEAKPVRVAFKKSAEDMRAVIPLGEVSPEELTRIEHEILGELGI